MNDAYLRYFPISQGLQALETLVFGIVITLLFGMHLTSLLKNSFQEEQQDKVVERPVAESAYEIRPVPSIAPLANKIPASRIDPDALTPVEELTDREMKVAANYMATKYRRDFKEILGYVRISKMVGLETQIDPLLIIAVMAVESNFDPDVESKAGAQGLMQVMTRIHRRTYDLFGGINTAFMPEANVRVGTYVLKQCISLMGSLEGGLRYYVGASDPSFTDGGFVARVFQERNDLLDAIDPRGTRRKLTASGVRPTIQVARS